MLGLPSPTGGHPWNPTYDNALEYDAQRRLANSYSTSTSLRRRQQPNTSARASTQAPRPAAPRGGVPSPAPAMVPLVHPGIAAPAPSYYMSATVPPPHPQIAAPTYYVPAVPPSPAALMNAHAPIPLVLPNTGGRVVCGYLMPCWIAVPVASA